MTGKKISALATAAVLAIAVLLISDWRLRAQSGWIGQERKKNDASQPFLANWVFPSKFQVRLQARRIVDRTEDVDSQDTRVSLFFQAIELLKDKDNEEERAHLLRRVCDECPDSPRSAEAWILRLRAKLSSSPPENPADEVAEVIKYIKRFGVGKNKVSSKPVEEAIKAMKNHFPDEAKKLQSTLDAAMPKKKDSKKKKKK